MRMQSLIALSALGLAGTALVVAQQPAEVAPKFSFAEPGISPDGREIAFASGGDIWSVPAGGGEARLLVAHDGDGSAAAVFARRRDRSRSSRRAPAAATSTC